LLLTSLLSLCLIAWPLHERQHGFILDTRAYGRFCEAAFGAFFHHVPSERMGSGAAAGLAMRRTWRVACREENIDPMRAMRVPLQARRCGWLWRRRRLSLTPNLQG
jgi:hypothetical protein